MVAWLYKLKNTFTTTTPATHNCITQCHNPTHTHSMPLHQQNTCKYMCILEYISTRTHSHTFVIPQLISIPLAVRSSPGWSSGEWRQAEPVHSAYYHRLAANLQGQHTTSLPLKCLGRVWLIPPGTVEASGMEKREGETAILCRSGTRLGSDCYREWIRLRVMDWWMCSKFEL